MNDQDKKSEIMQGDRLWEAVEDIRVTLNEMHDKLDRHQKFLLGADEPGLGLVVRLERLERENEERNNRSKWAFRTAVGSMLAAFLSMISLLVITLLTS